MPQLESVRECYTKFHSPGSNTSGILGMLKQGTIQHEGAKSQVWHSVGLNFSDGYSSGQGPHFLHSGYNNIV